MTLAIRADATAKGHGAAQIDRPAARPQSSSHKRDALIGAGAAVAPATPKGVAPSAVDQLACQAAEHRTNSSPIRQTCSRFCS